MRNKLKILVLLIFGAASAFLWFSLVGVWDAYVAIWLVKVLRTSLGLKGAFLIYAGILPFAFVSAFLFGLPFAIAVRRNVVLSAFVFVLVFLVTSSVLYALSQHKYFDLSYRESISILASDVVLWLFVALFIFFAWLGARIRNAPTT